MVYLISKIVFLSHQLGKAVNSLENVATNKSINAKTNTQTDDHCSIAKKTMEYHYNLNLN